jgi:hypothetical protein
MAAGREEGGDGSVGESDEGDRLTRRRRKTDYSFA